MPDAFARTALLLGPAALDKLAAARVAVFGLGGVGGHAAEALARSGIGALDLVDGDTVSESNLNRQIVALRSTLGQPKARVMAARMRDINPDCDVTAHVTFFDAATAGRFDFTRYDYVLDCIDTVTSKLLLIELCHAAGTRVISCMGAGNKMDATAFEVADIYETSVCPLAKVMRQELRKRGIPALKVVYSKEPARPPQEDMRTSCKQNCVCPPGVARNCTKRRQIPGSNAFVPAAAGLVIAGEVVRDLVSI